MKISEHWLRSWINPPSSLQALADEITMLGIEVEAIETLDREHTEVVVGKVLKVTPHATASLNIAQVDVGTPEPLTIVCGASNCTQGITVACALPGATLPGCAEPIERIAIRGVHSEGMLCSAEELGLPKIDGGILLLPSTLPIGAPLKHYLSTKNSLIDLSIAPNRGDCLSLQGLVRELATRHPNVPITPPQENPVTVDPELKTTQHVQIPTSAPRYLTRRIAELDLSRPTPPRILERLLDGGIASINIGVDLLNYVMLELGQPMHAFDQHKVQGALCVRNALQGESLLTLTQKRVVLDPSMLVISDEEGVVALAGTMGGDRTRVTAHTKEILLESAYFTPKAIGENARRLHLMTEAAIRYARGVDPELQTKAMERATQLLLDSCGGRAGPIEGSVLTLDPPPNIQFRAEKVASKLGLDLTPKESIAILEALGCRMEPSGHVTPPSWRFDLKIEADLLEEIARVYGFEKLPETLPLLSSDITATPRGQSLTQAKAYCVGKGYFEVLTYSFIDPERQALLCPHQPSLALPAPLSNSMATMRTSLLPGLLETIRYNQARQQLNGRFFEAGICFLTQAQQPIEALKEQTHLAGAIATPLPLRDWDGRTPPAPDFFTMKAEVLGLLHTLLGAELSEHLRCTPCVSPLLHPGQSTELFWDETLIGSLGALHPAHFLPLEVKGPIFLFELVWDQLQTLQKRLQVDPISRFPKVRRDLALIVSDTVLAEAVIKTSEAALKIPDCTTTVELFDLYPVEAPGKKSIAIALMMQSHTHTLTESEIQGHVAMVEAALNAAFDARLRT